MIEEEAELAALLLAALPAGDEGLSRRLVGELDLARAADVKVLCDALVAHRDRGVRFAPVEEAWAGLAGRVPDGAAMTSWLAPEPR